MYITQDWKICVVEGRARKIYCKVYFRVGRAVQKGGHMRRAPVVVRVDKVEQCEVGQEICS